MDRTEFQKLAVRTESVVDEIKLCEDDYNAFVSALQAFENSAEILDKFKKHIFYGKPLDRDGIMGDALAVTAQSQDVMKNLESVASGYTFQSDLDPRVFHALLGTITEHGEIATALLRGLAENELDLVNVCEELGDSDWYKALFYEATDIDWEQVQAMIIKKLEVRYADKIFSEEEAAERDLEAERTVLVDAILEAVNEYKQTRSSS